MSSYTKNDFAHDFMASLVVFLVALPLCLGPGRIFRRSNDRRAMIPTTYRLWTRIEWLWALGGRCNDTLRFTLRVRTQRVDIALAQSTNSNSKDWPARNIFTLLILKCGEMPTIHDTLHSPYFAILLRVVSTIEL